MLTNIFLACALAGGTVLVFQFVMAIIGLGGDGVGMADDLPDDLPDDIGDIGDAGDFADADPHGATALVGIISFRTVVAAIAFFGLAGMAAQNVEPPIARMGIALGAGAAAMYGVFWLMRFMHGMSQEGTIRIERSVGRRGTVYIPIPGANEGSGKIQLKLQDRLVEYEAVTSNPERLSTGAKVKVVKVISPRAVEVALIHDTPSK